MGGAYILHTVDWTNVKISQKIKYGIITEINGEWNGKKYRVASVYRPCFGTTEGSLRVTMDIEYKAKFEDEFWYKLGEIGNETCIIGGDFNMRKDQMEKRLIKEGIRMRREDMAVLVFIYTILFHIST